MSLPAQTILSALTDAVIVLDQNKNISLINKAGESMLGKSADEATGHPIDYFLKLFEKDADVTSTIYETSSTKNNLKLVSKKNENNNKTFFVNLTCSKLVEQNGISSWVLQLHDISSAKQLETMKEGFVSMAAHELRTPLTSMKGYLSVFMEDYKNTLNADQKDLLNHVAANTQRLLELVENLLNVSRVERGALTFNVQVIDLISVAKQVVEDFNERALEKSIELKFRQTMEIIPNVRADKVRITEVLGNLIGNAINYTSANGRVEIWCEKVGDEVVTYIADNGQGISEEAQHKLFTKFYRVSDGLTKNQNSQGNGLGLYISKSIMDMHRGKIWVDSKVGYGTRFAFSLPL